MAHIRQSRPGSGRVFQVNVLQPCHVVPSSLGSGRVSTLSYRAKSKHGVFFLGKMVEYRRFRTVQTVDAAQKCECEGLNVCEENVWWMSRLNRREANMAHIRQSVTVT